MNGRPGSRQLRIAIATSGRFHVLDLARELILLGHDVTLYSMLPSARAEAFGLARTHHHSLLPFVAPLALAERYSPKTLAASRDWAIVRVLDAVVSHIVKPCDFFICMSGIYLKAARAARRKYGAKVWLERGSRHILSQAEILANLRGATVPTADMIERELAGYLEADRIVVPACHVAESFERDPSLVGKLFRNPYGVDLDMFPQAQRVISGDGLFRLIFAGVWCVRKGCDVLEAAVRGCENVRLDHFGRIGDLAFPKDRKRFIHHGSLPQQALAAKYAEADAFILTSREEGLSIVQVQALATGLPLICSDRTGGEDVAHTHALRERIVVIPHDDVAALRYAIETVRAKHLAGPPALLTHTDRVALSWRAYAERYSEALLTASRSSPL